MKKIAISTTLPMEILLATGAEIVDLNNRFVTSSDSQLWLFQAEQAGFPKSLCAWIKGLYSACLLENPDLFIAVTEGDCSNTKGLNAILEHKGIPCLTFGYPQSRTPEALDAALRDLAKDLNVSWDSVALQRQRLKNVRQLAATLDEMTYKTNQISGFENHLWLVSCSDFNGNLERFEAELSEFIEKAKLRPSRTEALRLAYIGVPPMFADLYEFTESHGARVVFNEVQRQFAMTEVSIKDTHNASITDFESGSIQESLAQQYSAYTYPYDLNCRLEDIQKAIQERKIHGVIHYTQAFCHRALDDLIIKDKLDCPVLTIEGDQATSLDGRTKLRIEAFLDLLGETCL